MSALIITPVEFQCRLRIRDEREIYSWHRVVVGRWLNRIATRRGYFVNFPSLYVTRERDPARRKTYLYVYISAVPEDSPKWLAIHEVETQEIKIVI